MTVESLAPLVPLLPLIGVLLNGFLGPRLGKGFVKFVGPLVVLGAFLVSVLIFLQLQAVSADRRATNVYLWEWIRSGVFRSDVAFLIDPLSITMMLVITGVGFLIHVYSAGYMADEWRFARYFTYLRDCPPAADVVLGDARLTLASAPSGSHGAIVLDAYSADAIPTHLLTREAFQIYVDKLAPGGVLAFHISNLYFDLEPVVSALAHDAGLVALIQRDPAADETERLEGKSPSHWMVLARSAQDLAPLSLDPRWRPAVDRSAHTPWTDDLSSPLPYLKRP